MVVHEVRERRVAGSGGAHPHRVADGRQREAAAQRRQRRRGDHGHRPVQRGAAGRATEIHAGSAHSAPSPRGREQARLEAWGETPRPRPDRIASFGIALTGHPSSHALPSGGGLELIYAAHPEATQVAGGRCRVRARSWAVRGTHDSFEGASPRTCSAVLAVVSYNQRKQPAPTRPK